MGIICTKNKYKGWCIIMQRGEIWIVDLHRGVGSEQGLVRPGIIVQNNIGNKYAPTVTIVPLTAKTKKWLPTHATLVNTTCLEYISTALAEQITTIDKARLIKYIGKVDYRDMENLNMAIKVQNGLVG